MNGLGQQNALRPPPYSNSTHRAALQSNVVKSDVIFVDVDNQDSSVAMARPDPKFVELDFLRAVKGNCLSR